MYNSLTVSISHNVYVYTISIHFHLPRNAYQHGFDPKTNRVYSSHNIAVI